MNDMTPMNPPHHLSEEDRHAAADGTLDPERARDVAAHLDECEPCATDVGRLRALMRHLDDAPPVARTADSLAAMWPEIRSRIEERKILPLAPSVAASDDVAAPGAVAG